MLKSVIRYRDNKKGSMAIEIIIGCFIFLLLMCFFIDVTTLTWKFSVISQANSYIARTAGIQGGLKTSPPSGFPGGGTAYDTSSEVWNNISQSFNSAGIEDGDYTISINGITLRSTTNMEVDYQRPITTTIVVNYEWTMLSNFIPGRIRQSITSRRTSMSEFKYRYDSWIGE